MKNKNFISINEFQEYKKFTLKEDMIKVSLAFVLGTSFRNVVTGISNYLVMPIFNYIMLRSGSWDDIKIEPLNGMYIEVGKFLGTIMDFFLISVVSYFLYYKILSKLSYDPKECLETKECPLCKNEINVEAKKCPECTGDLN
jgi:large conductance mechanosensitive channel